jgi:phage-related protein
MIPNFETWAKRYALNRARDPFKQSRAIGQLFDWCVAAASVEMEPDVIVAQFGDGYAQRRAAGINNQPQAWSIEMRNAKPAYARAAFAFLKARGGVDVFNWYEPRTDHVLSVICPSWTLAYGTMLNSGERLLDMTAQFQEVYL